MQHSWIYASSYKTNTAEVHMFKNQIKWAEKDRSFHNFTIPVKRGNVI